MPFDTKSPAMQKYLNKVSEYMFGMKVGDALRDRVCVKCHEDAELKEWKKVDVHEYKVSGLCPDCFLDIITDEAIRH